MKGARLILLAAAAAALAGCSEAMRHGSLFVADVHPAAPEAESDATAATPPPAKPAPAKAVARAASATLAADAASATPVSVSYRYYPAVYVYFDPVRKLYFFPEKKKWKTAAKIPARFKLKGRKYVTLTLDTPKPFTLNKAHRLKYPPPPKPKPAAVAAASVSSTAASAPSSTSQP